MTECKDETVRVIPFDIVSALDVVNNNVELYERLVNVFFRSYEQVCEQVARVVEESEYDLITDIVHMIKGTSGNLGMEKIYDIICDMERYSKSNDFDMVIENFKSLRAEMTVIQEFFSRQEWKQYVISQQRDKEAFSE
ncbi:MAG: Hpt domain-containing protein [Bacillota bacterium]